MVNHIWGVTGELVKRPLFFYGAGLICRRIIDVCALISIRPNYISDMNPDLWGKLIDGIRIISPSEMRKFGTDIPIIVTTMYISSAVNSLAEQGFTNIWCFNDHKTPPYNQSIYSYNNDYIFNTHKAAITRIRKGLADRRSVETVDRIISYRKTSNPSDIEAIYCDNEYYPSDIIFLTQNEVFIDGGSYNGDTIHDFIKRTNCKFNHIYAFEPQPFLSGLINDGLMYHIARSKITVIDKALSENEGKAQFTEQSVASRLDINGVLEVETESIDNLFKSAKYGPTYIKLDIEGAEMAALKGAERTVESFKPKLAICIYHKPNDLWEIPAYLMERYPFYDFYIRHHSMADTGTVLYAVER